MNNELLTTIIQQARDGDKDALEHLYYETYNRLFYAYNIKCSEMKMMLPGKAYTSVVPTRYVISLTQGKDFGPEAIRLIQTDIPFSI